MGILKTDINKLIKIYRNSLIALIPTFEEIKINWKSKNDYAWDNISEFLYVEIVISNILHSKEVIGIPDIKIPFYDFSYENYKNLSIIEIKEKNTKRNDILVFQSFKTIERPFDFLVYNIIDINGKIINDTPETIAYEENIDFNLKLRLSNNKYRDVNNISIIL